MTNKIRNVLNIRDVFKSKKERCRIGFGVTLRSLFCFFCVASLWAQCPPA